MAIDRARIAAEFATVVNMSAAELADWLATSQSQAVGWRGADGSLAESVGHASGRRVVAILEKDGRDISASDYLHMRKVVGFVRRHLAQEPANPATSRWRYALMNWGHDPLKA